MLNILDYIGLAAVALVVVSYVYVAYAAVGIRRTLAGGAYRRQALGICLIALTFVGNFAGSYFSNFIPSNDFTLYYGILSVIFIAVFFAMALVLLYWVDSSILASRRSDPLFRDTLRWSRIRPVVWVCEVSSMAVTFAFFFYYSSSATIPDFVNNLLNYVFPIPIYIAAFSGVLVMPIAARRSRDPTLRKHLEWFFVFIATQLVLQGGVSQIFANANSTSALNLMNLVHGIALIVGLYPLYRSAKSLVPLYKFEVEKSTEIGEAVGAGLAVPA